MNEPQPKHHSQGPVTKKELEEFLKDQTRVILDAVDERLVEEISPVNERLAKLEEKFDPIMTGIDKIVKELETHRDEDKIGAKQLRRHEDKLNDHESRIKTLEAREPSASLRRP
jgi:uncharacterized coiled-coil DUF342 family protein